MSSTDISKVYQFLANIGDWKTKADKNGDGTVIKSEFCSFMENNYEWDGETTEAGKNDLINSFWKTIDTNQSGKLSGTRFKNKNALDSKEINAMQDRIAIYESLNTYVADIQAPNEISDKAGWKKSISASLANTTETLIKQGVTADTLAEELDKIIENVKNKTTADYCANEYLNTSMKDVVKQYGYAYADDATLKGIIDNFVNNLPEDSDSASIKQTVEEIINAYMATATGDGSEDISILEQYGYTPSNNTAMNDLQKSIVKTKLTEALADLKNEADYENNSALYDTAINEYIEAMLNDKTYSDYTNNAIEYSLQAFKDSETGKALEKTLKVKNLFNSDEFKTALTNKLSSSFADRISGLMKGEISAYDDIQTQALEKAKNGDFDTNGTLDTQKVIDWVVEQMTQRLTEFYPNGLNDMSLTDLGVMYDKLVESAKANEDAASVKTAALSYCNAVAKKSTLLSQAVKDIFGDSYATEINKLTTPEIEAKMTDLKAKVDEIGDPATCVLKSLTTTAGESLSLQPGTSSTYSISANITSESGAAISPDRISYVPNSNYATVENGILTIKTPSSDATFEVKIYATVDGKKVGEPKTIKVTCKQKDYSNLSAEKNVLVNGEYISDVISKHTQTMKISEFHRNGGNSLNDSKSAAKESIKNFITTLVTDLTNAGYNATKLQYAATTLINYYNSAIDAITDQEYGDKDQGSHNMNFSYVDGNGQTHTETSSYYQHTRKKEKNADWSEPCQKMGLDSTGIQMNESYNKTNTYNFYINTGVLLNRFMKMMNI